MPAGLIILFNKNKKDKRPSGLVIPRMIRIIINYFKKIIKNKPDIYSLAEEGSIVQEPELFKILQ